MERISQASKNSISETVVNTGLPMLVNQAEERFFGSLQRIWANIIQLEDLGIIKHENDKFVYAYQLAEIELRRAYSETLNE